MHHIYHKGPNGTQLTCLQQWNGHHKDCSKRQLEYLLTLCLHQGPPHGHAPLAGCTSWALLCLYWTHLHTTCASCNHSTATACNNFHLNNSNIIRLKVILSSIIFGCSSSCACLNCMIDAIKQSLAVRLTSLCVSFLDTGMWRSDDNSLRHLVLSIDSLTLIFIRPPTPLTATQ